MGENSNRNLPGVQKYLVRKVFKKDWVYLILIFLSSFLLFYPSIFTFFTHDDFYLLNISEASNLTEFLAFFNPLEKFKGLGMYRPLTTQAFYFLGRMVFGLNPVPMHIISFFTFFLLIWSIYRLFVLLTKDKKVSLFASFLYATSATHFAHLYYLATFQEIAMALFVVLSVTFFVRFKKEGLKKFKLFSLALFVLSLMSKETAIVLPFLLLATSWVMGKGKWDIKKIFKGSSVYFVVLLIYLVFRFSYGFASGESYIWDVSFRVINTYFWYLLWSFNLPELLVDYVGPGFRLNENLMLFWGMEMKRIFLGFIGTVVVLFFGLYKKFSFSKLYIFGFAWFLISLVPVIFLPLHKFTFYLTLPLVGIVLVLSKLLKGKRIAMVVFGTFWIVTSIFTIDITKKSHWIVQGAEVSQKVYDYFVQHEETLEGATVAFFDEEKDKSLPWSPTKVVRVAISENNFFDLYFKDKIMLVEKDADVFVGARQFLNY